MREMHSRETIKDHLKSNIQSYFEQSFGVLQTKEKLQHYIILRHIKRLYNR